MVGGGDKGGVLVRQGKSLTSEQVSERLSTGAVVKELKLEGDRLHFELETGSGPQNGWVSTKLKDKELLTVLDGEKPTSKDVLKKKSWDVKFLFSGCGANLRALEGGTEGASREQLFEFLMKQHVSPELRKDFWEQIPDHMYDTSKTNETDCITFFQTVGHLCPADSKRLASPGGVRQYLASDLPLRGIFVEPDGLKEAKVLVVLCHGIEVLGHDLYLLSHNLCDRSSHRRFLLPEAPHESAQPREEEEAAKETMPIDESLADIPEWRKPLREWWSRTAKEKEVEKRLSEAAEAVATCCNSSGCKVVLGGFSQGAAVALAAAPKVKKLAGLLLLSPPGFSAQLANSVTSKSPSLPSLVTAGSEDPIAPREQVEAVHKALSSTEPLLVFEGGHEVTMKVVEGAKSFLAKVGQ